MVNTNYGDRPVSAEEIVAVFGGSADAALKATGGENRLALFYVHNPELAVNAARVTALETDLTGELRRMRDEQSEQEKVRRQVERLEGIRQAAREAWAASGTIAAVMRACRVGRPAARRLVEQITA